MCHITSPLPAAMIAGSLLSPSGSTQRNINVAAETNELTLMQCTAVKNLFAFSNHIVIYKNNEVRK